MNMLRQFVLFPVEDKPRCQSVCLGVMKEDWLAVRSWLLGFCRWFQEYRGQQVFGDTDAHLLQRYK